MTKFNMIRFIPLILLLSCGKSTLREEQAFQFANDMMTIGLFKDGSHLDTLASHFDIPLDSEGIRKLRQTWIPWGKPPIGLITLKQSVSMNLDDGPHYYMIVNLYRANEARDFNYLIEVFDSGSKLWLRQFYMYETNSQMFRNVTIKKKKDRAVWWVKTNFGKGIFDGKQLTINYKFPSF